MEYYISVLRDHYADFEGRARRKEYWMFALMNFIVSFVVSIIANIGHVGPLSWLYSLAVLVPSIAVGVRRLHDTDRSGWWWFIVFIPIIGAIILIVWLATDSLPGANQYGANPKEVSATAVPTTPTTPAAPTAQ